jgi:hypothetical protein
VYIKGKIGVVSIRKDMTELCFPRFGHMMRIIEISFERFYFVENRSTTRATDKLKRNFDE